MCFPTGSNPPARTGSGGFSGAPETDLFRLFSVAFGTSALPAAFAGAAAAFGPIVAKNHDQQCEDWHPKALGELARSRDSMQAGHGG